MTVERSWERIENRLREHAPEAFAVLREGAAASDVDAAEERLGLAFPAALRESLLRHDGQEWRWPSLVEFGVLMPLEHIVDNAELNSKAGIDDARAEDEIWWRRDWIPFVSRDGDALSVAVESGGEVWCFQHDMDPIHSVIAPDFETWLQTWADELEAGVFELDRAAGAGLLPREGVTSRLWP